MKKIKLTYLPIVGLFCLMLFSCNSKTNKDVLVEVKDTNVINSFNLSELSDSCIYVKLETSSNCLIGDIDDILYIDNMFFILSSVQGVKKIFVFDKSGRFLNRIGTRGNGPGEYLSMSTMGINPFEKQVIIYDPLKNKIHKYDFFGNFLESLSSKKECAYIQKVRFIAKDRIRYVSLINSVSSSIISESSENLDNEVTLFKTNFIYKGGYRFAENPISSMGNYLITPMSNIIYIYNNGNLDTAYELKLNSTYEPLNELEKGGEFESIYMGAIKKGFSPLNSISECKDYLLIKQIIGNPILWNKKTNTGFTWKGNSSLPTSNYVSMPYNSLISGFDKGFIIVLPNNYLINTSDYYKKEKILPNNDIMNFLTGISIENNPTICIYVLKKT